MSNPTISAESGFPVALAAYDAHRAAEPVAWRVQTGRSIDLYSNPHTANARAQSAKASGSFVIVEPLYTAPQPIPAEARTADSVQAEPEARHWRQAIKDSWSEFGACFPSDVAAMAWIEERALKLARDDVRSGK